MTTDKKIVNFIKTLALLQIDKAKSGHPGIVLGAGEIIYTLFKNHLRFNPNNPNWLNRDRFILSAGHGSALLYSTLGIFGYDYDLELDLLNFRSLQSKKTPGHPEYNKAFGVEVTSGPLGQGIANAVGLAFANKHAENTYNTQEFKVFDNMVYCLCSDGDLQEGISYESLALASKWKLDNLVLLYDSNNIQLDSKVEEVSCESTELRCKSLGINYIFVKHGNSLVQINEAIASAKSLKNGKPTLIEFKTVIGKHSSLENTTKVHGSPLTKFDLEEVISKLGYDQVYNQLLYNEFRMFLVEDNKHIQENKKWDEMLVEYSKANPNLFEQLEKAKAKNLTLDYFILYKNKEKFLNLSDSTRVYCGKILSEIIEENHFLIGGSADLSCSTMVVKSVKTYDEDNPISQHLLFGVREHAMAAISLGFSYHDLYIGFCSTFFAFSDYLKPALRLACLSKQRQLYIFSHDSFLLGKDGPTHQPIEHLGHLRMIPNLYTFRPCDYSETLGAFYFFQKNLHSSTAIVSSRQKLTEKPTTSSQNTYKYGGYVVFENTESNKNLDFVLVATGSEVDKAIKLYKAYEKNFKTRVVSIPCLTLFLEQPQEYIDLILGENIPKVILEASNDNLWYKLLNQKTDLLFSINSFGASDDPEILESYFSFDYPSINFKISEWSKTLISKNEEDKE